MQRHGDTTHRLAAAIAKAGSRLNIKTLVVWRQGKRTPRTLASLAALGLIERRYRLRVGYFRDKLPHPARASVGHKLPDIGDADPNTFFIKTVKTTSASAEYNQTTFYEAWRLTIQHYGVFNPYTGRGAIKGLLPHGPHNIRDVLATHILKKTGSYEQASYAIQDTPEMVSKHYGRFLPQDKAALAAQILNKVWEAG